MSSRNGSSPLSSVHYVAFNIHLTPKTFVVTEILHSSHFSLNSFFFFFLLFLSKVMKIVRKQSDLTIGFKVSNFTRYTRIEIVLLRFVRKSF